MDSENSKTSGEPHRFRLDLAEKPNVKHPKKHDFS